MRFSERMGYAKPRLEMQIDSMDEILRNRIWNQIDFYIFKPYYYDEQIKNCKIIWTEFFKRNIYDFNSMSYEPVKELLELYKDFEWFEVYDLIEFLIEFFDDGGVRSQYFVELTNNILTEELSGFRISKSKVIPVTDEILIEEINDAAESTNAAGKHIENAISNLSDKTTPDYRTTIKESIDAVESICKQITKESADMDAKTTLGAALKELKNNGFEVHSALIDGWSKIYGYASDGGIRHDLEAGASFDQEDAIYFLSTCAAFVNYLKVKADKHGINLE